jgi:hypothetical protein
MQENNTFHGDVSTENIFFCPNDGCFKIYDNEIYNGNLAKKGRGFAFEKTRKKQK